jgi:predicted secreted protein
MDCAGFYFDGELPTNFMAGREAIGQQIRVAMSVLEASLVDMGVNLSTVTPNASHTIVGDAIITNCEYSGSRGGLATYRISMQGSGELTPIL